MPLTAEGMTNKIIAKISDKDPAEQKKILMQLLQFNVMKSSEGSFFIGFEKIIDGETLLPKEDPKNIQKAIINYLFDNNISFIDDLTEYFAIPKYMTPWINERLSAATLNTEPLPPAPPTTPPPTLPDATEITRLLSEALNTMEKSEQNKQMQQFLSASNKEDFIRLCQDFFNKKGIETTLLNHNLNLSWNEIKNNLAIRNTLLNVLSSNVNPTIEWEQKLSIIQDQIRIIDIESAEHMAFKHYLNKTLDTVIQAHSDVHSNQKTDQHSADYKKLLTLLTETQNTLNQLQEKTYDNVDARYGEAYQTLQEISEHAKEISTRNGKTGLAPKTEVKKHQLAAYVTEQANALKVYKDLDRSTPLTTLLIDALNQLPPEEQQKRMQEFSRLSQENDLDARSFRALCTKLLGDVGKPCTTEQKKDLEKHWKKIQTNLNLSAHKLEYDGTLPEVLAYNISRRILVEFIADKKQGMLSSTSTSTINDALLETAIAIMKEAETEKVKLLELHAEDKIDEKTLKESMTQLSSSLNSIVEFLNDPTSPKALKSLQKLHKDLPKHTEKMSNLTKFFIVLGVILFVCAVVGILIGISIATHGAFLPFIPHTLHLLQAVVLPYFTAAGPWAHIGALIQSGTAPALAAVKGFVTGSFVHFVNLCQSTMMHFVYQPIAHGAVSFSHQTVSFAQHLIHGLSKMPLLEKIGVGIGVGVGALASVALGFYGAKYANQAFLRMRGREEKAAEKESNQELNSNYNSEDDLGYGSEDDSDSDSDYGSENDNQIQDSPPQRSSIHKTNTSQTEHMSTKAKIELTRLRAASDRTLGTTDTENDEKTQTRPRRDTR